MNEQDEIRLELAAIRRREIKEAMKEAIKEYLSEREAMFGRWSLRFFIALLLSALLYGTLIQSGWAPPLVPPEERR
jgi:hypothetical protein